MHTKEVVISYKNLRRTKMINIYKFTEELLEVLLIFIISAAVLMTFLGITAYKINEQGITLNLEGIHQNTYISPLEELDSIFVTDK